MARPRQTQPGQDEIGTRWPPGVKALATHLPIIAAMGDVHYRVEKETRENHTATSIRLLTKDERVQEIAKFLGGEKVTEATIQNARELLNV